MHCDSHGDEVRLIFLKWVLLPHPQDRPGGMGARDLHEDGGAEESGDRLGAEGLHRGGDVSDAGRGGHLQGQSERQLSQVDGWVSVRGLHPPNCAFTRRFTSSRSMKYRPNSVEGHSQMRTTFGPI